MLKKSLKYALLINAEVIKLASKRIKESSETFLKENVDSDYEKTLSDTFDNIEKNVRDLSPHIDKSITTIKTLKDNIVDFSKTKLNSN